MTSADRPCGKSDVRMVVIGRKTWRTPRRLEGNAVWSTGVGIAPMCLAAAVQPPPSSKNIIFSTLTSFQRPPLRSPKRLLGFITSPRNDVIACVTSSIKLSCGDGRRRHTGLTTVADSFIPLITRNVSGHSLDCASSTSLLDKNTKTMVSYCIAVSVAAVRNES